MNRISTARWTGIFYLVLAISGMAGFLLVRNELFVPDDATATLANLLENPGLARVGIFADLTIVVSQALAALWFFKLFRDVDRFAAISIAAFGLVNSVAIMVSVALTSTAAAVAADSVLASGSDRASAVQLLYTLSGEAWNVGSLFFGLWLVPMGVAVLRSGRMPALLGRVLVGGGLGYVLSTYLLMTVPAVPGAVANALVVPATIGEFWMIGALLTARLESATAEGPMATV